MSAIQKGAKACFKYVHHHRRRKKDQHQDTICYGSLFQKGVWSPKCWAFVMETGAWQWPLQKIFFFFFFRVWGCATSPSPPLTSSSSLARPETYFQNRVARWWIRFSGLLPFYPTTTNSFCHFHSVHGLLRVNVFFSSSSSSFGCAANPPLIFPSTTTTTVSSRSQSWEREKGEKNSNWNLSYRTTLIWSGRTTRLNINRALHGSI